MESIPEFPRNETPVEWTSRSGVAASVDHQDHCTHIIIHHTNNQLRRTLRRFHGNPAGLRHFFSQFLHASPNRIFENITQFAPREFRGLDPMDGIAGILTFRTDETAL